MKFLQVILLLCLGVLYVIVSKFELDNNVKALGVWGGLALSQMCGLLPMASKNIMVRSVALCCVALGGIVTFNSLTEDARNIIYVNKETKRLESQRPTPHDINACWAEPVNSKTPCKSELLIQQRDIIDKQLASLPKVDGPLPTQKQWIMWSGTAFLMPLSLLSLGVVIKEQFDNLIRDKSPGIANANSTITNKNANQYKLGRKKIQIPVQIRISEYQLGILAATYEAMLKDGHVTKTQFWKRLKTAKVPGFSNYTTPKLTWWWENIAPIIEKQKPPLRKRLWQRVFRERPPAQPKQQKPSSKPAYERGKVKEYINDHQGDNVINLRKREITA